MGAGASEGLNRVSCCELFDNVGKGEVVMVMVLLVVLAKGLKRFAEVMPILMECGFVNASKKYTYLVVSVKAEVVGSHLVDLGLELFHVDLE